MKPFNLEEALAGKLVVTRDGRKVTHITRINDFIVGIVEDIKEFNNWTLKGNFLNGHYSHICDLFMFTESKFLWINLWQQLHENGNYHTTVHTREDLADLEIENNVNLKHIQKLTMIL